MAEVYGTKPKKFTKEWWPYFWMYYKWQTIGIIFVILAVTLTAFQCATNEKFDLTITYAGSAHIDDMAIDEVENILSPMAEDADGNGKRNVGFQQLNFSNVPGSAETDMALQQKLDVGMTDEDTLLYIFDIDELNLMAERESSSDIYMDVSEWLDADIKAQLEKEGAFDGITDLTVEQIENNKFFCKQGEYYEGRQYSTNADEKGQYFYPISEPDNKIYGRKVIYDKSGIPIAISIENSAIMLNNNINSSELYISVRKDYSEKEKAAAAQRSAVVIANELLKQE